MPGGASRRHEPEEDLLLGDVAWHHKVARRMVVWACSTLVAGSPMIARLVIGLQAPWNEVDPWGPADAFVILGGILCWGTAVWLFARVAFHERIALEIARWQLRDMQGNRVSAIELRAVRGAAGLRRWVARHHAFVIPIDALLPQDRRSQLLIAARGRLGTMKERRDSFGDELATAYERGVRRARRGAMLMGVADVVVWAAAVGAVVEGGPSSLLFWVAGASFLAMVVLALFVRLSVRRGPDGIFSLAASLLPALRSRDARLDVNSVAAMISKPRLYDLWAELHW
jgi:hypothetical protein